MKENVNSRTISFDICSTKTNFSRSIRCSRYVAYSGTQDGVSNKKFTNPLPVLQLDLIFFVFCPRPVEPVVASATK